MEKDKLWKLMDNESGYVTAKDISDQGIHRQYLTQLVREGKLERVASGLYQNPQRWGDSLYAFQFKKSKIIYSHETALFLHDLSDRDPNFLSITCPNGYHLTQTNDQMIRVFFVKPNHLSLGSTTFLTSYGNQIRIYDMERTICDVIRSRNKLDYSLVIEGIRRYSKRKDKDINRLMEYAELFRVQTVIKQYLELLL